MEIETAIRRVLEERPENTFLTTRRLMREMEERFPYLFPADPALFVLPVLERVLVGEQRIVAALVIDDEVVDLGIALEHKVSEALPRTSLAFLHRVKTHNLLTNPI